jgi:cell shape-determining protein MreD
MLWHKLWLDTRSRFLIGLALLLVAACSIVVVYPKLQEILPTVGALNVPEGPLTQEIEDTVRIAQTYRGYVWTQWFDDNLIFLATLFAAILGSGNPLSSRSGTLFSLALPVSRGRWIGARAATGLVELFALVMLPSLAIVVLSLAIGEQYGLAEAAVHGLCAFIVAAVFFAVASFFSTLFNDAWRPVLLTFLAAVVIGIGALFLATGGPFAVMSAESYFRDGSLPWAGLLISVLLTVALLYATAFSVERRDF